MIYSHVTDDFEPEAWRETERIYAEEGIAANVRPRTAIGSFVSGLDLVDPGLVECHLWRPDGTDASTDHTHLYAAVGLKRPLRAGESEGPAGRTERGRTERESGREPCLSCPRDFERA